MGNPKGTDGRVPADGRHQPELTPYRILKIVKGMGPVTVYGIWKRGPVSKYTTVKRHLRGLLRVHFIKELIEECGRVVYSVTEIGENVLRAMDPMFENMITGRTLSPTVERHESQFTSEDIMSVLRNLTNHLKKEGVIDADYQLSADGSPGSDESCQNGMDKSRSGQPRSKESRGQKG